MTYGGKEAGEMYGGILQEPTTAWMIIMRAVEVERDDERRWVPITTGTTELSGQGMADYGIRERGRRTVEGETSGLDRRAANARNWWRRGGKSKRIEALRGEEVHAGRRSDRWGKWAVKAVVDVDISDEAAGKARDNYDVHHRGWFGGFLGAGGQ